MESVKQRMKPVVTASLIPGSCDNPDKQDV